MDNVKSILKFNDYKVKYVSFELNDKFKSDSVKIDFNIRTRFAYADDEIGSFATELEIVVFEDAIKNNYPFEMKIILIGEFYADSDDFDLVKELAEKNSVSILFPYARSIISTYTANSNISALILPPINVLKMLEEK